MGRSVEKQYHCILEKDLRLEGGKYSSSQMLRMGRPSTLVTDTKDPSLCHSLTSLTQTIRLNGIVGLGCTLPVGLT